MDMARLEIPVSGWTCLRTRVENASEEARIAKADASDLTLVDVGGVGLLPGLGALLLLARGSGSLLAGLLLLSGSLASRGLAAGGGSLLGLGGHFCGLSRGDGFGKSRLEAGLSLQKVAARVDVDGTARVVGGWKRNGGDGVVARAGSVLKGGRVIGRTQRPVASAARRAVGVIADVERYSASGGPHAAYGPVRPAVLVAAAPSIWRQGALAWMIRDCGPII